MTTETKADEFKVGDKVYCAIFGEGEVVAIWTEYKYYPIHVEFSSDKKDYTNDGRLYTYANRTLFFSEPKIEASVTRPFVPTLVGKRVVVVPKFDRSVTRLLTVSREDSERIFVTEDHYWDKDKIEEIYEVSSENLLT